MWTWDAEGKKGEETQLKEKDSQVFPALLSLDDVLHHRVAGECANSSWTNVTLLRSESNQFEDQIEEKWTYVISILNETVLSHVGGQ